MRAIASEADVAASAPDFTSDGIGWPMQDDSGEIASWCARQGCAFHAAKNILRVAGIERSRADADDQFVRPWMRIRKGLQFQFIETAEFVKTQRLHVDIF